MNQIAEVCVNVKASRLRNTFSYRVPPELAFIGPGWRVIVPFGSLRVEGFVLELRERSSKESEVLKSILEAPDESAWFDDEMLATARWISEYYVCSPGESLRLFIPGKSGVRAEQYYQIAKGRILFENFSAVYDFINRKGPVNFSRLRAEFGAVCREELQHLEKEGLIETVRRLGDKAAAKWQRFLQLAVTPEEAEAAAALMKGKTAQKRILERLAVEERIPLGQNEGCIAWDAAAKALVQSGFACQDKIRLQRDSYCEVTGSCPAVAATDDQQKALALILPAIESRQSRSFLLHGVTGSGKTEVYLQAAAAALSAGRQVLALIPEIAQTSQLLRRFKARFGAAVAVVHSKLSVGERRDVWDKFRTKDISIVIGTRSALFMPSDDLGLIIVDEEHEFTYKQEESPRYHVRDTALQRAALHKATVVFGSATPALETYYAAVSGRHTLIEMPRRVDGSELPAVEVVDMREQLKQGRKSIVSAPLESLLKETMAKGEQAILLLNRRGHSTFVLCRECGLVLRCEHCNVPLVYHMQGGRLLCHYCDSSHAVPTICPSCHSRYIRYFGAGTQKLEEELSTLLPGVRLARFDQDTTGKKGSHDRLLDDFRAGGYDILLGTQMVAKGHDIENVTAVGILAADSSLNLPDFRSAERTFSLIMQAAGRAGRGAKAGRVVVQTYHPSHYAVQAGAAQNYEAFYEQEAVFRKELQYPPFAGFLKLTVTGNDEAGAMRSAEATAELLREREEIKLSAINILGPFVAPMAKIGDTFRVHILLQGEDLTSVKKALVQTGIAWARDITVDVDPLTML